jgi:hypothetical protein
MPSDGPTANGAGGVERAELIERFKIPFVWRLLNLTGEPALKCASPFREDNHPSFSIFDSGRAFQDFSTGQAGNVFRFFGIAQNLSPLKEYAEFKRFLRARGFALPGDGSQPLIRSPRSEDRESRVLSQKTYNDAANASDALKAALARLTLPTREDCEAIAKARSLDRCVPYLAGALGLLLVGDVGGFRSWVLTDASRRLAEARRFDNLPFPAVGALRERKSHTLKGSQKADWPLGVSVLEGATEVSKILLVEGGPDFLAALQLASQYGHRDHVPIAFMGAEVARSGLHPAAEALLRGKQIRIIAHVDAKGAGARAAEYWRNMLSGPMNCRVDCFELTRLDPRFLDLNDAVRFTGPLHSPHQTALANSILL